MAGPFKISRFAVAGDVGTEGTFTSGNIAEADATVPVYDATFEVVAEQHDRNPSRGRIGALAPVAGARYGRLSFGVDLRGSGAGGTAPKFDKFLRGCGLAKTVASGSAAVGSATADTRNRSTAAIAPTAAGTYAGSKSGRLEIVLETVTTDTSCVFRWTFRPDDGSAAEVTTTTHTSTSSQTPSGTTYLDGVTWATALDPNSSTTGWIQGDRWTVYLTSSSTARVRYRDTGASHECLDLAFYQIDNTGAFRYAAMHSARGTFRTEFILGQPARLNFELMGVLNNASAVWVDGSGWTVGGAYDTTVPPAFLGAAATRGGSATTCFRQIGFDLGAEVTMRECANEASGYKAADIVSIRPTLTWDPQAVLVATDAIFTRMLANTQSEFVAVVGSTTGNKVTMTAPKYQETQITQGGRGGIATEQVTARCCEPEYDAGGEYHGIQFDFE